MMDEGSKPNFCVNCRWVATNGTYDSSRFRCFAPDNLDGYDLVTGTNLFVHRTCEDARAHVGYGGCGKDGLWFEPISIPVGSIVPTAAIVPTSVLQQVTGFNAVKKSISPETQAKIDAARARIGKRIDPNKIVEL